MAKNSNIVKYHRGININIGVIIFAIIIIYVIFNIFSYFTSSPVAVYEVRQGTIATNSIYRGLILRDETIEYAKKSGYINYYVKNAAKVSVSDIIYTVDMTGDISKEINSSADEGVVYDSNKMQSILDNIESFSTAYNSNNFSEVYSFKLQLGSELTQSINSSALKSLKSEVNNAVANDTFFKYKSKKPGVIVYSIDGYEDVTVKSFTGEDFEGAEYTKYNLDTRKSISDGEPVYKKINSENWNILVPISDTTAKELKDTNYIKIKFCKDGFTYNCACSLEKKEGVFYLNLSLKKGMIRYVNDRFIEIELVIHEDVGLKIPNSAITEKEFYLIPKEYFTSSGDSKDLGVIIDETEDNSQVIKKPNIYNQSKNYYYVDKAEIPEGTILKKPDSNDTYIVGQKTGKLTGVYNINKGYAIFKKIKILSQNTEYTIIENKSNYGIVLYDHIALDGKKIKENQTVIN